MKETYFLHFQHEGGGVSFKIIIYTNSGENLIGNTKRGVLSWDKRTWNNKWQFTQNSNQCTALCSFEFQNSREIESLLLTYLGHDLTQSNLFEIGGFPAHVGPSDDDKVAALGDVAIVRYRLLSHQSLQNGVTTLLDGQCVCELWTHWQTQQKRSNNNLKYLNLLVLCLYNNCLSCIHTSSD